MEKYFLFKAKLALEVDSNISISIRVNKDPDVKHIIYILSEKEEIYTKFGKKSFFANSIIEGSIWKSWRDSHSISFNLILGGITIANNFVLHYDS